MHKQHNNPADTVFGEKLKRKRRGRPAKHSEKDPSMLRRYRYAQVPYDAYFTPPWCVEVLFDHLKFEQGELLWEPFVGAGNIAQAFEKRDFRVVCSDIKDYGYPFTFTLDFNRENIEYFAKDICDNKGPDWIVTNPPYHNCKYYVERVLWLAEIFQSGVVMLLRNEFDCGKLRSHIFQNNDAYWGKIILTTRPRWFAEERASPRHNYSWYIWDFRNKTGKNKNLVYSYRGPEDGEQSDDDK